MWYANAGMRVVTDPVQAPAQANAVQSDVTASSLLGGAAGDTKLTVYT